MICLGKATKVQLLRDGNFSLQILRRRPFSWRAIRTSLKVFVALLNFTNGFYPPIEVFYLVVYKTFLFLKRGQRMTRECLQM